ncbi:MAG: S-layer homology domain-containing protein, partial [Thermovirgaceae bacterium]
FGQLCTEDKEFYYEPFDSETDDAYLFGARLNFAFNEQFGASINYLNLDFDEWNEGDQYVWWVAPYVNFTPEITLRGAYFQQSIDGVGDENSLWKAILDVKQEALGFTSVWIEYVDVDKDFYAWTASRLQGGYGTGGLAQYDDFGGPMTPGLGEGMQAGTALFVRLDQQWDEKWATFQRWATCKLDGNFFGFDPDTTFWTFGVKYWYTPAIMFELSYDDVSYGDFWIPEDNNMIRLRTHVWF